MNTRTWGMASDMSSKIMAGLHFHFLLHMFQSSCSIDESDFLYHKSTFKVIQVKISTKKNLTVIFKVSEFQA